MSQSTPPPAAIRKLPIGETVGAAYATVFTQFGLFLKAAFAPFLISAVIACFAVYAQTKPLLFFGLALLGFVPYTLFGVAWHRLTLLGPIAGTPSVAPSWQRRHWRFLGYAFAVILIVYFVIVFLGLAITGMATFAGQLGSANTLGVLGVLAAVIGFFITIAYLVLRMSFVFPAVSVDENYRLNDSWAHTSGQGMRLVGTAILVVLPLALAMAILGQVIVPLFLPELPPPLIGGPEDLMAGMEAYVQDNFQTLAIVQIINTALGYVLTAVLVAFISSAFRSLTGWVPDSAVAVPAPHEPQD